MRILVTGTQGQIARALLERGAAEGVAIEALGRPVYDLLRPSRLAETGMFKQEAIGENA